MISTPIQTTQSSSLIEQLFEAIGPTMVDSNTVSAGSSTCAALGFKLRTCCNFRCKKEISAGKKVKESQCRQYGRGCEWGGTLVDKRGFCAVRWDPPGAILCPVNLPCVLFHLIFHREVIKPNCILTIVSCD